VPIPLRAAAFVLFFGGWYVILAATKALGMQAVYFGDHFGILKEKRVTAFPYDICDNPLYLGTCAVFLSLALWYNSVAGIYLTAHIYICYVLSTTFFEEPFTAMIYREASKKRQRV
jgi:methylene-fatty-acyl-phospholipid synthase